MMLRWPPLGLCTTEATEEGVCSTQPKRAGPLENGRHWFDDEVAEAGIKSFRWHDFPHTFASRLRIKGAPGHRGAVGTQEFDDDKTVRASGSEQAARRWYGCSGQVTTQVAPAKTMLRCVANEFVVQ